MAQTLSDLNSYLFDMIDKLSDEDLTEQDLEREISRSKSMERVARAIIDSGRLQYDAAKLATEYGGMDSTKAMPALLGDSELDRRSK